MTHCDGAGNLDQVDFIMANGAQSPTTSHFNEETGPYAVNPVTLKDGSSACTGTATIVVPSPCYPQCNNGEIDLEFVLGDGGNVIHTIVEKLTPPGTLLPTPNPSPTPAPANIHSDAEK